MSSKSTTRTVDAPPEQLWAVLADFGAIATWTKAVDHSCVLSAHREGQGVVRRVQAGPVTLLETVLTWDPPRELVYSLGGLPKAIASAQNAWTLTASADGERTSVTLATTLEPGPKPAHRLVATGLGKVMGRARTQMLDGLAAAVAHAKTSTETDTDTESTNS